MVIPSPSFEAMVFVSIVSHGHGRMVEQLVTTVLDYPEIGQVMVTHNIAESLNLPKDERILTVYNRAPAGFAANHNKTFAACRLPYFCLLNPDIQLPTNPFPALLAALQSTGAALAAPLVKNPAGQVEDSIRHFPSMRSLLAKALGGSDGRYPMDHCSLLFYPEWVAGMFMLFCSADFKRLGGFDARFFLYYEDVDICVRSWKEGMKVLACPEVTVIHDARRESRHNFRYMGWHLASMIRYLIKHWGRLPTLPEDE